MCPLPSAGLLCRPHSLPALVPALETASAVSPRPRSGLDRVAAAVLRQCREGSRAQIRALVLSSLHGVLGTLGPRPARPP